MPLLKSRLIAVGLVAAGLGAAAALGVPHLSGALLAPSAVGGTVAAKSAPAPAADNRAEAKQPEGGMRVEAPHAQVDVDKERGKVSVKAPYTDVQVDPDKGRVQVRAPYVNLDIRW
jgi:hypothetical protein